MSPLVLSDLTWLLPKVLKKVPWQVRATFLAIVTLYGAYSIAAQVFGWPISREALEILGILAVPAGLPALSNVTVHKGTRVDPKAVEDLADQLDKAVHQIHLHIERVERQILTPPIPAPATRNPMKKTVAKRPAKKAVAKKVAPK